MEYKPHPAAEVFPLMEGADFDALVEDIRENGLREPITVYEGMILDGRNRYRACQRLGVEPATVEWPNGGTAEAFVISKNITRRHLTPSQRAMLMAQFTTLKDGQKPEIVKGGEAPSFDGAALSVAQAAKIAAVGSTTMEAAKAINERGTPEQQARARAGESVRKLAAEVRKAKPSKQIDRQGKTQKAIKAERRKALDREAKVSNQVWRNLTTALDALGHLPAPEDVARLFRGNKRRSETISARLPSTANWMRKFSDEWNSGQD